MKPIVNTILSFALTLIFTGSISVFGQGPNWKWQNPLPTGNSFYDVHFVDAQTGWAVGWVGTILKTTNGGSTWSIQNSGTPYHIYSIQFIDNQTGWAVGDSAILKTSNGGTTWIQQGNGNEGRLTSVYFINNQTGWAAGSGKIYLTSDG